MKTGENAGKGGGGGYSPKFYLGRLRPEIQPLTLVYIIFDGKGIPFIPGGGTLGISGWGRAAGTLEPLTYTRASAAEFCYPILE